jgi:hypothetical protein
MVKTKKLKLRPSARDCRRYFLIKSTNSKVEAAILEYIGVLGFAKSAYMKVTDQDFPGYIVGSCLAKSLDEIRAALSLSGIKIKKVSGTLKALKG